MLCLPAQELALKPAGEAPKRLSLAHLTALTSLTLLGGMQLALNKELLRGRDRVPRFLDDVTEEPPVSLAMLYLRCLRQWIAPCPCLHRLQHPFVPDRLLWFVRASQVSYFDAWFVLIFHEQSSSKLLAAQFRSNTAFSGLLLDL